MYTHTHTCTKGGSWIHKTLYLLGGFLSLSFNCRGLFLDIFLVAFQSGIEENVQGKRRNGEFHEFWSDWNMKKRLVRALMSFNVLFIFNKISFYQLRNASFHSSSIKEKKKYLNSQGKNNSFELLSFEFISIYYNCWSYYN